MRRTLDQVHELQDPLVIPIRIICASRDQNPLDSLELLNSRYLPALVLDHEPLINHDTKGRIVILARSDKVPFEDLAEGALLFEVIWVGLVNF